MNDRDIVEMVIQAFKKEKRNLFEDENYLGQHDKELKIENITKRPYSIISRIKIKNRIISRNYYIKIPIDQSSESIHNLRREYETIKFYRAQFKKYQEFGIINPVLLCIKPAAMITREVRGKTLQAQFRSGARILSSKHSEALLREQSYNCGEFINQFHSIGPIPEELGSVKSHTPSIIRDFINSQLKLCSQKDLLNPSDIDKISKSADTYALAAKSKKIILTGMYSDFCLSNIIADGRKIFLIDFGGFQIGPVYRDVAVFLYSLDALTSNPIFSQTIIERLKTRFLQGYGWRKKRENIPLFKLFQLRETLGGLIINADRCAGARGVLKMKLVRRKHGMILRAVTTDNDF